MLEEVFLRRGMDVIENGRASAIDTEEGDLVRLVLEDGRDPASSHVLLCIGMRPNTHGLGLDAAGSSSATVARSRSTSSAARTWATSTRAAT